MRDSRPNPDEDGLSYYKAEFLEDSSESEDLVYGAGQESDLLSRASSSDYSNLYTIEYGDVFSYKENGITSLYEDLADYWGLHASSLVTRVAGIPFGRTLFLEPATLLRLDIIEFYANGLGNYCFFIETHFIVR